MSVLDPVRVLIVPGLHDSEPGHWQSWLQAQFRHSLRVRQADWEQPDLQAWSARIDATLASRPGSRWIAVAHSFGCLALAHHLARQTGADRFGSAGIRGALFVAPADPDRFGVATALPSERLPVPSRLLASDTDPWMPAAAARTWASNWGSRFINLGDVGHINTASGFGPLPQAKAIVADMMRRLAGENRIAHAHVAELSFSI
jgi:predicted alpha/beta hydrolase family esterase